MRRGSSTASIVASPVLVGAVTVLIVIVGVFLAYNANNGLPFVPTYDLKAELPSGQKLVRGNDVRVGGFRVGVVDDIKPGLAKVNGQDKAVAIVSMKLEKTIQPLSKDTIIGVRPRSSLGLKYVELIPGKSKQTYQVGDTIPLSKAKPVGIEYEDVFSTFDQKTRDNSRTSLKGFGDAFAGRGASINEAIGAFNPFFRHLTPVMKTLAAPDTQLDHFFKNIGHAAAEVAPVAKVQAELFPKMATTFDAISHCPGCLRQTIEKSPPSLQAGIESFPVQRPFLAEFTTLSKELRPTVATLHSKLGTIDSALETGIPVLKRTPILNKGTEKVFRALDDLAQKPQTLLALEDLRTTFAIGRGLLEYVAPYQTVCNNAVAWLTGLSGHLSMSVANGTSENILVKTASNFQKHTFNSADSQRPADLPSNWDPQAALDREGNHYQILHSIGVTGPAVDAQGNANCDAGQTGYMDGPYNPAGSKYEPAPLDANGNLNDWENSKAGGSHVTSRAAPVLRGGSYVARRLGINNLKDVP
jgi:ABC-type transporter Mla subunit MlaD